MNQIIKIRARLVIIKNNKLLLTYTSDGNYFFYVGGKMEYGETLKQTCEREIKEECGENVNFAFNKILYVKDFIKPEKNEHSLELFILGDIDKCEGIEGWVDGEFKSSHHQTWVDIDNLPPNILPKGLTKILLDDYKQGFPRQGVYISEME